MSNANYLTVFLNIFHPSYQKQCCLPNVHKPNSPITSIDSQFLSEFIKHFSTFLRLLLYQNFNSKF